MATGRYRAGFSRRKFLRTTLVGGAALATGAGGELLSAVTPAAAAADAKFQFVERTIPELQAAMATGELTAQALTQDYLQRIATLDRTGPRVNSVLQLNPDAMAIAAALDRERKSRGPRGLLHGIPVLVKDNIATRDQLQTTAGSRSLLGSKVPADSPLISYLRAQGAVLLGKTNLSEWANFRSTRSNSGWSGRGGLTNNPYVIPFSPCGSSSGSGAAVSANFCAAAVGTETDGSVVCPSSTCGIVGIKPTLHLISQQGIIPIAKSQDTAGPMGRTVTDVAIMLGVLSGQTPDRYLNSLRPGALEGGRIGVARQFFGHPPTDAVINQAIEAMEGLGAVIIDPVVIPNVARYFNTEFTVLLYEFNDGLNRYLADLVSSPVRTLADIITFDNEDRVQEMPFFGQDIFYQAQAKGPLTDDAYLDALHIDQLYSRRLGIDAALAQHRLDALVAPTAGPAWRVHLGEGDSFLPVGYSSSSAVAGYPHVTVPAGFVGDFPIGLSIFAGAHTEDKLLGFAYAFEQGTHARRLPRFLGDTVEASSGDATSAPARPASAVARL